MDRAYIGSNWTDSFPLLNNGYFHAHTPLSCNKFDSYNSVSLLGDFWAISDVLKTAILHSHNAAS